ncbi:hypothetical protein [Paucibacter sp. KCTC 42545]|uniref:hypothetical protein n=1 Tax=Paucibacter sp. KCTC 42545 TaxID=1768242 RepID=UPI000A8C94FA|nr:hypothetical protein [Paucibacter sp. KCTC 42545]
MSNFETLPKEKSESLFLCDEKMFGKEMGHVQIKMDELIDPKLIWINRRILESDPAFVAVGNDLQAYENHILKSCAAIIDSQFYGSSRCNISPANGQYGVADRYGGAGIGHNGGSGRNALLNGYLVKGIGRTPLVSKLTPLSHASGGAYLEECVRETIFGEIVDQEFPYGAIPTLAIIDTGIKETWPEGIWPEMERRTLLVRPTFVRPAHFERAIGFISENIKEGVLDQRRVEAVFSEAIAQRGKEGLITDFKAFFFRWAHQLAYSFVNRLPHGNNTSSNIAFDGRLVDFGAMTAVPSWSITATSLYPDPYVERFENISAAIRSLSYYFGRHLDPLLSDRVEMENRISSVRASFFQFTAMEVLRLCGVPDAAANSVMQEMSTTMLQEVVQSIIGYYQTEHIDFIDVTNFPKKRWDIPEIWLPNPPKHLRKLNHLLHDIVPATKRADSRHLCIQRCRSRPLLYKPGARDSFFRDMDEILPTGTHADSERIAKYIDNIVSKCLRI